MNTSVSVTDLTKNYGRTEALTGLSFSVEPGSIYGIIGPNGAGKTTALSILAGLRRPTSGRVAVLGVDVYPGRRELAHRIGFFSPQYGLFDYLKGGEILLACGLMHGLSRHEAENRAANLLELLDLQGAAGQFVYEYSQGMRLKLGLSCALIHAPEVLLLDEPFLGLDATSVYRMVCTLRQMAEHGRTVVLSSHELALVQRVCDRVGILHEGRLKHETHLQASQDGHHGKETPGATPESSLESLLWDVVGTPEVKPLSWI